MNYRLACMFFMLMAGVIAAFTFLNLPGNSLFWDSVQNSGHAIVFAALALITLELMLRSLKQQIVQSTVYTIIILSVIGMMIELLQYATGRGASFSDLILDASGILSGSCLYFVFHRTSREKYRWTQSITLLVVGIVAMIWGVKWPVIYLVTSGQRPSIPVLANFEDPWAHYYVNGNGSTQVISVHPEWPENLTNSLKVIYEPGRYPTVYFQEPEENWSDYSTFSFDVFNPSERPVNISVRIDDRSLGHFDNDHMTVRQVVPEGSSQVMLELELFKADAGRRKRPGVATFKQIHGYMIFTGKNEVRTTLFFDNFSLQ